jgi:hypothetical protein
MARSDLRWIYALMALALILSGVLVLNSIGIPRLQSREFQTAKNYALSLVDYNLDLAQDLGVPDSDTRVTLAYRRLQDAISTAATPEELYHIILTEMSKFEQIIREQADYNLTTWLEWTINQDPNLNSLVSATELKISFLADRQVEIQGGEFLDQTTIDKISSYSLPGALRLQTVTIAVDVVEGLVMTRVKEPRMEQDPIQHLQNQFQFLEQEYKNLRSLAGYSELSGAGIIISLMDAEDDLIYDELNIIHDIDVQEIVHSLYASGALGIAIAERRLVSTSSIRCVGGPILVNYEPVPVKPLIITAVGDPEAMAAYLESLLDYYVNVRNLRVEITQVSELRLPAYRRR